MFLFKAANVYIPEPFHIAKRFQIPCVSPFNAQKMRSISSRRADILMFAQNVCLLCNSTPLSSSSLDSIDFDEHSNKTSQIVLGKALQATNQQQWSTWFSCWIDPNSHCVREYGRAGCCSCCLLSSAGTVFPIKLSSPVRPQRLLASVVASGKWELWFGFSCN